MPWHLKSVIGSCQECGQPASHVLYDNHGTPWGHYCKKHGTEQVLAKNHELEEARRYAEEKDRRTTEAGS